MNSIACTFTMVTAMIFPVISFSIESIMLLGNSVMADRLVNTQVCPVAQGQSWYCSSQSSSTCMSS